MNPESPCVDERYSVQVQCVDRGTTGRRQTGDDHPVFLPVEVIEPILQAGIEKPNGNASLWVDISNSIPFQEIASPTRQAEIVFGRRASKNLGDNVINRELSAYYVLWGLAIAAPMLKVIGHSLAQRR